jgi:hypothetical protein
MAAATFYKLANDQWGHGFELDADAKSWRVQRLTGKRGAQETLYSDEGPLQVGITSTIPDFKESLRASGHPPYGRFKLTPVDAQGVPVGKECGYITLRGEPGAQPADEEDRGSGGGSVSDAAVIKLAEALVRRDEKHFESIHRIAEKLADVVGVNFGQLVKGYSNVQPVTELAPEQLPEEEDEPDELSLEQKINTVLSQIPQLVAIYNAIKAGNASSDAAAAGNGAAASGGATNGEAA